MAVTTYLFFYQCLTPNSRLSDLYDGGEHCGGRKPTAIRWLMPGLPTYGGRVTRDNDWVYIVTVVIRGSNDNDINESYN